MTLERWAFVKVFFTVLTEVNTVPPFHHVRVSEQPHQLYKQCQGSYSGAAIYKATTTFSFYLSRLLLYVSFVNLSSTYPIGLVCLFVLVSLFVLLLFVLLFCVIFVSVSLFVSLLSWDLLCFQNLTLARPSPASSTVCSVDGFGIFIFSTWTELPCRILLHYKANSQQLTERPVLREGSLKLLGVEMFLFVWNTQLSAKRTDTCIT